MRIVPLAVSLVVVGSAVSAGAAWGADRPLLVSVEVGPGVDLAPTDVRRAVAAELGNAVVGASEPTGDAAADVLLVALGPREIRMSLRAGTAPVVSRAIPVPADRPARLRSIGWLAGNLVRDQVGPIVATREAAAAPAAEALAATEPPALPSPPPAAGPPAPVPSTSLPVPSAPPVVASSAAPAPAAIPHAVWSITATGGPVVTVIRDTTTSVTSGGTFQLELQRQRSPESVLLGLAFSAGPAAPRHYAGAAAFAGEAWRGQSWFAEATLGLGVEALDGYARIKWSAGTAATSSNPPVATDMSESRVSTGPVPGLYVRAAGTGGFSVSRFFDLVAQLGAHLSSEGDVGSYLGATAGVRLRLP